MITRDQQLVVATGLSDTVNDMLSDMGLTGLEEHISVVFYSTTQRTNDDAILLAWSARKHHDRIRREERSNAT